MKKSSRMIGKRAGEGRGGGSALFLLRSTKTTAGPSIEGFLYFPSKRHSKVRGVERFFFSLVISPFSELYRLSFLRLCLISSLHWLDLVYGYVCSLWSFTCYLLIVFPMFPSWSPCAKGPSQNGGTCVAQYYTKSYVCVCAIGFTEKDCQTSASTAKESVLS